MLIIKNWKALFNGQDITNRPILNYVGFRRNGSVAFKPSPLEDRSEWTCIIPEEDDDRIYYRVYYKDKQVAYCKSRKEAEQVLEIWEQVEYECENCKEDEFYLENEIENV